MKDKTFWLMAILLGLSVLVNMFFVAKIANEPNLTSTGSQQWQIAYAEMTLHANELEKQNLELNRRIQVFVSEINTIPEKQKELQEILKKHGIE